MPNILVGVKYSLQVENLAIDPKTTMVSEDETPKQMGDMDKRALEEAIRIREKIGGSVTALCVGPSEATKIMMEAYAMGANEAYLLPITGNLDTDSIAKIFAEFYKKKGPFDLIILGASSTDSFTATLGARIASLLGIPVLPFVKKLELADDEVTVESDLGDGTYTFKAKLPVVVTVTLEINEPRIPTLKDILKAKRKKINEIKLEDLGLGDLASKVRIIDVKAYEEKRKQIILDATDPSKIGEVIDHLINYLKEEGVL